MKTHFPTLITILVAPLALAVKDRMTAQRLLNTQSDTSDTSVVGVLFPVTTSGDANDEMPPSLEQELVEALETDDQVTVVGDIMVGVLSCESLEGAEDATELRVAASPGEVITAERTSYTFISGDAFDDGIGRHVWVGEEVVDDIMDPQRAISITWGEECNVETFLFKVTTTETEEEAISVVRSIPCIPGASTDLCIVETEVTPEVEDEPDPVSTDSSVRARNLVQANKGRRPGTARLTAKRDGSSKERRQLQSTTTIDVLYLYNEGGKTVLGGISDTQMQTTIATGVVTTNQAMINSEIDVEISPVHIGLLPYDETSTISATVLDNLEIDEDVASLRDDFNADLVQLYANLGFSCGRGNLFTGNATEAFSTVNPLCLEFFTHTHELGHNFGCYHNRDNTMVQTDYAHGYRYCETTDPYRTIMSNLCPNDFTVPRVNWFSNPDVALYDNPTGTTDNDCARAIEDSMVTISEFRPVVEPPVENMNPCFDSSSSEYRCNGRRNGRILDLNRCDLTDTDVDFLRSCFEVLDITNIRNIKLNVNSFTSLPFDLFDGVDSLASLNLRGNCDLTCVPPVPTRTNVLLSGCSSNIGTCDA